MRTFLVGLVFLSSVSALGSSEFRRGQVSGLGAAIRAQRLQMAIGFAGIGAGLGVAGAVIASNAVTDGEKKTAGYSLGIGIGMTVGAVLTLFLRNPYERAADEFLRLSASESPEAVERRFQELVTTEKRHRLYASLIGLAASGAVIGIGFASSSNTKEMLIGVGAGSAAAHLFSLLFPPPGIYESIGNATAQSSPSPEFRVGLAPVEGGAVMAAGVRF